MPLKLYLDLTDWGNFDYNETHRFITPECSIVRIRILHKDVFYSLKILSYVGLIKIFIQFINDQLVATKPNLLVAP